MFLSLFHECRTGCQRVAVSASLEEANRTFGLRLEPLPKQCIRHHDFTHSCEVGPTGAPDEVFVLGRELEPNERISI